MIPVLIFEGHDRSGKTTIANKLAEKFDTEVFMTNSKECFTDKAAYSKDSSNIAKFNFYIASLVHNIVACNSIQKPIIIYRSFLSEMVYSEIFERATDNTFNNATDMLLSSIDSIVILCKNDRDQFDDELLSDVLVKSSIEMYDKVKLNVKCDVLCLDTSSHNVDAHVDYIMSYIKNKNSQER